LTELFSEKVTFEKFSKDSENFPKIGESETEGTHYCFWGDGCPDYMLDWLQHYTVAFVAMLHQGQVLRTKRMTVAINAD